MRPGISQEASAAAVLVCAVGAALCILLAWLCGGCLPEPPTPPCYVGDHYAISGHYVAYVPRAACARALSGVSGDDVDIRIAHAWAPAPASRLSALIEDRYDVTVERGTYVSYSCRATGVVESCSLRVTCDALLLPGAGIVAAGDWALDADGLSGDLHVRVPPGLDVGRRCADLDLQSCGSVADGCDEVVELRSARDET